MPRRRRRRSTRLLRRQSWRRANRLLRERRRILDETLKKTVGYLQGLPDAAYFEALLPLAARSAQAGEGLLLFGAGDLKRLPADFEARLNRSLETGKKLTVSPEAAPSTAASC